MGTSTSTSSQSDDFTRNMGMGASQANNTQNSRVGNFGTSREKQMAAANVNNEGLKKDANQTQAMGMGAGAGQQAAIKQGQEQVQAQQSQGNTPGMGDNAGASMVGANGKIQTGFGDARQQQQKQQMGMQAEMAKNTTAQQAGLGQTMGKMTANSNANANVVNPKEATAPEEAIDYNEVYNTEAQIFNQKQASDWGNRMDFMSQRAKERGMEGTDLNAYLSHMELGNRMGLLDARQSIMMEGLQKDMAFKEKDYWQTRSDAKVKDKESYNQYMELLNASWGDEEAVQGILEMAAGTMGEDSYFANLLKNPDILRNLNDAGYNEIFQQRNMAASNVLREMTSPTDMGEINSTFGAYKNAKYGSAMDISVPSELQVGDLDPKIYADYVEEFGEPDMKNAEDIKNVYAYQQYRKDVKNSLEDEVATGLVNEFLTNGGNPETAEKIRNLGTDFVFSLMEDEALSNYIGGQVNADDPVNGPLSFMFSDWQGNIYGDENAHANRPQEDKNLDLLWQDYMKTAAQNGEEPISRQEFLKAALEASDFSTEKGNTFDLDEDTMSSERQAWINERLRENMATSEAEQVANVADMEVGGEQFMAKVGSMSPSEYKNMWSEVDNDKLTDAGFINSTLQDLDSALSWDSSKQEVLNLGVQPGKIIQGTDGKLYEIAQMGYYEDDSNFVDYGALIMYGRPVNEDGSIGDEPYSEIWRTEEPGGFGSVQNEDGDNWEIEKWSK